MTQYISQNNKIILPYLREAYDYGEYKYDSHSVSPDGNYIAMYLTITGSDGANPFAEPNVTASVLKLFKICDDGFEPHLAFCKDLLNLSYCENLSILWSATGNKLICEYQINDTEPYNLIYFDITDEMDTYPIHNVFNEHETYKWEHSMSFSEDDSTLVTVYNREIIRVFEYSAETRNYHFKTEERNRIDGIIYTITNIYLTEDNKLIVALYNSADVKHIVVSYQINDDRTELQYLTENRVTTLANNHIFHSNKCEHDGRNYLILLTTFGINYHSPSHIYIYDLTELKITEVIDINNQFGRYMVRAHKMLFGAESLPGNEDDRNYTITPLLCYPPSPRRINLAIDKYIWIAGMNHRTENMFNVFTKEKIFTAYSPCECDGILYINGIFDQQYTQLYKTSNKVYVFTNDEREPYRSHCILSPPLVGDKTVLRQQRCTGLVTQCIRYKAMYNLNKFSELMPIKDIKFIHDNPSHVICEYNNKLWFGHSLPFCEEKNVDILTNLLHEYMPVEVCHLVSKYCC